MNAEGRDASSYKQLTALPAARHSSAMVDRKKKPASAYAHYQKLSRDFDSLEREMQSHESVQRDLEAQLERAQAKLRASRAEERQAEKDNWEQERDRQLEMLVQQQSAVDAIRTQVESLDAEELRLQAEMEVIRERQQEVTDTEAQRIRRLVHDRTSLLEDELTKGKMDLDYIANVISSARRQELKREIKREANKTTSPSVQSLVQDVQDRRRREFEASEANFQERMHAFQLEKEALAKKAKALRVTKQRALQILSQNQQLAIKEYFDTTQPAQLREASEKSVPSLNFGEILHSLNQSGAYVEQVQILESERNSGRRELANALNEAHLIVEQGPGRVEDIQKRLADRKAEAQRLGIEVGLYRPSLVEYDGAWRIESYSPHQYDLVYFLRGLVFSWMDAAVAEGSAQPAKEILELELKRWQATHSNVEYEHDRENFECHAQQVLTSLVNEVIADIAEDIRLEFEASARRVRSACLDAFRSVLFATTGEKPGSPNKTKTQVPLQSPLRWSLFESSLNHLRARRRRESGSKFMGFLHQCSQPVISEAAASSLVLPPTKSPMKKILGIFSVPQKRSNGVPATHNQLLGSSSAVGEQEDIETVTFLSSKPTLPSSSVRPTTTFWKNEPHLHVRQIAIPSSIGCCSSLQLSPCGDLLVCGTTDGELVLWDLTPDQPVILRVWSPPKAQRSRVTKLSLSANAQVVIAFFKRKTVCVLAVNPPPQTKAGPKSKPPGHSEGCFPTDPTKFKARSLHLLAELSAATVLGEMTFTPDVKERVPSAVAKATYAGWSPAELSFASCFQSFSLLGIATCDTSMLCGTTTGDLLKYNLQPQRKSHKIQQNGIQAAFDAPGLDSDSLNTHTVRREFFRGHRRTVLFASCLHRTLEDGAAPRAPEILSVDQDSVICLWEYSAGRFTGFGWFEPTLKLRLELSCPRSDLIFPSTSDQASNEKRLPPRRSPPPPATPAAKTLKGEMLQIALTPDDTRLVFMAFYADPTRKEVDGTLRFFQLLTGPMRLDPVPLDVAFTSGNGAPRFALTTSFLLLLVNNRVQVYTLRTGKEAREPIALSPPGQQHVVFHSITSTASSKHTKLDSTSRPGRRRKQTTTTLTFVVACDQHPRLLAHSFTAITSREGSNSEMNRNPRNVH